MQKYTKTAMLLHWLIALLIIAGFSLGVTMVDIPGLTPTKLKYFAWHKWLGITVLGLACARLLWRLGHKPPPYPMDMPLWQEKVSALVHGLLYVLIFAVPVSGYLYTTISGVPVVYLGLFEIPSLFAADPELKPLFKQLHYVLNVTLLAAVSLHVLAALKHHFIDRDKILKRMLP